jgi:predicted ATPase/DNA-binding CsgD family transcriptional regulator
MAPQSLHASRVTRAAPEWCCGVHAHRSLHARRAASLPNELSSFVGREYQLEEVTSRLRAHRLVTLSGGGGIGKTRLALQVARRLRLGGDACTWVPLSSTIDEAELASSVSNAVFGTELLRCTSVETAVATISDQELVLVLDNCEQVIDACADVVLRLLEGCSGLRVLVTSREPLGVPGEVVFPVPPLLLTQPDGASASVPTEAVRLFFDRAQARDPRLRMTAEAEALAAQICAACEGVPLAIELAAACTGSMSLTEIAGRLEDTLGLLRFGARAAPARQQSMRASIDWSHQLLPTQEQMLLRRLSVFETDFTLADAEWVCAFEGLQAIEIGYLLDRLVAQSLVHASREGSLTRYSLSRGVRQFGLEQLVQANESVCLLARLNEWSDGAARLLIAVAPHPERITQSLPGLAKSGSRRPDTLSDRERCVVQLIAAGRSNREIAEELVITKKTAEAHVSHILTKLGLCSRVQIATWSLQQGVLTVDSDVRSRSDRQSVTRTR